MAAYAEFAVTTNFSFLRGASHAEELVAQAKEFGLAAIGIADRNSVAGVVRAHEAAKEAGIRLAVGARLVFADGTPDILAYPQDHAAWRRLTRLLTVGKRRAEKGDCLLGLDDLLAHVEGLNLIVVPGQRSYTSPRTPRSVIPGPAHRVGPKVRPMAGSGRNPESITPVREYGFRARGLSPAPRNDGIKHLLLVLKDAAPRAVWLGASMLYRGDDARRLARLAALSSDTDVPLIAIGDVLYHAPGRRALQDVLTCIREHLTLERAGRRLAANAERHLKSPAETARLFRAAPQAVAETLRFIERCRFSLDELAYDYPEEVREGFATPQEALVCFAEEGARRRYPQGVPAKVRHALDHEYALIAELKYAPYFLTVHDIVRHARSLGILCQGRGSAANSAVCYCLGITEVDPERSDLLFERFVSAERREPPDIDVDFEHERREEVIQYIYNRYGRERAGLAATVICYRARSAIREVGKAFGLTDDAVGALAGTLWGWSVEAVSEKNARRVGYDPADPRLARVLDLAHALIGFPRHLSQHVGGFVITRGRLDDVVPIENAAMEDRTVIEWDKDDLDTLRILKIDVLGLGMLTCLRRSLDFLEKHYPDALPSPHALVTSPLVEVDHRRSAGGDREGGDVETIEQEATPIPPPQGGRERSCRGEGEEAGHDEQRSPSRQFDLSGIPLEDRAVYRMLMRADSVGVFQVESRAQMSMLPRLRPEKFYDLVIEVAIVRPGPIQGDMVHPYLRRRQKLEETVYPSPSPQHGDADELAQVLGKTLGVPLFQEQAMRIAIVAAGFTPSEADKLRRAMATFRRVGTIKYFRDKLVEGMAARGYPREFAERCFHQIEGFGEYGFPESHAASFALLVYASAWIKCRYPDAFAAALLNSQPMGFYAPAQIVRDAQEHGVEVRAVDVNHSDWDNTLEAGGFVTSTSSPHGAPPSLSLPHKGGGNDVERPCPASADAREPRTEQRKRNSTAEPHAAAGSLPPCGGGVGRGVADRASGERERKVLHPRHADMKDDIRSTHALRLGFRQISGFSEEHGRAIAAARREGFDSIRDLWLRTRLPPAVLERLAVADAFRSLGLDRRKALWAVRALRRSGDKDDLPLFARVATPEREPDVSLPPMRLGEHVVEDYRHLHLSLKAHPVSFLRDALTSRGILSHERLAAIPSGRRVSVAGIVLVRQRPGSANGVIFMTLEDETGIANTIVWPQIFEIYRPVVLGARLIQVTGKLQNESGVIHVVADRLEDLTPLLRHLSAGGPGVESLARCDEVKRPIPEWRLPPRSVAALATILKEEPDLPDEAHTKVRAAMPKGRNFH